MPPAVRLPFLCLLFAVAPIARAAEGDAPAPAPGAAPGTPTEGQPAPAGQLTKMPVLKRFVDAPYPPEAEKARVEGAVLLEIDIGADGKISNATVLEPAGHGFDEAALAAVKQFEFEPAEIDHVPSPVRVTYRYEFVLRPEAPPPPSETAKAPGPVVLEGTALERGTRVPLANAVVSAEKDGVVVEAACDERGHFEFRDLAPGEWKITVLAANFERYVTTEEIRAGEVATATFYVRRRTGEFEVTIRAKREKKEVARRTVTLEEIRKIPGTQGDAIRIVQNLPGVARTPLGLGPLIVRGGRPGDTRTYIDGQIVPLLFHFGGLTSVINSDLLDTLDFYPGNYPVRFGRSIAGAVDVNTRPGKRERLRGYANVSLTESTAFLEGPLGKKGSFVASVRRSYIDTVLPVVIDLLDLDIALDFQVARFWDYQLKTDWDFGRDQLSFFLFGSDDKLAIAAQNTGMVAGEGRDSFSTNIAFHRFTAGWKRRLGEGLDNRLAATLGTDYSSNALGSDLYGNLTLNTLTLRDDVTWRLNDRVTVQAGLDLIAATFEYVVQGPLPPGPGEMPNLNFRDQIQRFGEDGASVQPGAYVDAVVKAYEGLKLVPGLRYDYDAYLKNGWWDPRLTAFYEVNEHLLFKASAGLYHQPPTPDKLLRGYGNPDLDEEGSAQYAAGVEFDVGEHFSVDLQGYYKDIFDEAVRAQQLQSDAAKQSFDGTAVRNSGLGRAYGVELLLRREPGRGKFFGWLAVSLGQVDRKNVPEEPWTQSWSNQRFNVVGVGTWKLPWYELEFGTRVRLTDGNPATELGMSYVDTDIDQYIPLPSPQKRTKRRPPFFQPDLRLDRRWVFEKWIFEAFVEVQNFIYWRNVEGDDWNYDFTESRPRYGMPIFPFFGVRGEF